MSPFISDIIGGLFKRDKPQPPPTSQSAFSAWTIGPIIGGQSYSPGMPLHPTMMNGGFYFDFPQSDGVHYVTRPVSEPGRSVMTAAFDIDGSGQFVATQGTAPAAIRLFLQRRGDTWSDAGGYEHFRWWSVPLTLAIGSGFTLSAALTPDQWTNGIGQHNVDGFMTALGDLESVGVTFGGEFAGHGVYVVGSARFTMRSFFLS